MTLKLLPCSLSITGVVTPCLKGRSLRGSAFRDDYSPFFDTVEDDGLALFDGDGVYQKRGAAGAGCRRLPRLGTYPVSL
jgi:hypothetical protein